MDSFGGCFYPRYTPYPNMDQFVIQDPKDPNTVAFLSVSHDQKVATAIVLSPNPFQVNWIKIVMFRDVLLRVCCSNNCQDNFFIWPKPIILIKRDISLY